MGDVRDIKRYVVIPTHNRHRLLTDIVHRVQADVDVIIIVDNASEPCITADSINFSVYDHDTTLIIISDPEQPPNLSRLWNVGIDLAALMSQESNDQFWDVSIFNDDVIIPPGWFDAVSNALRSHETAIVGCSAIYSHLRAPLLKTAQDHDLLTRMTPWAFTMKGEKGLRYDETMRWWWSDTDLDWQARLAGGVLIIPGYIVLNTLANSSTIGELAAQAGRDRVTFGQKWGYNPW